MNTIRQINRIALVLLSVLIGSIACKDRPPEPANGPAILSGKDRASFEHGRLLQLRQMERDHAELVLPPPPGFRPLNEDRKIALRLILERTKIKVGERPRFRLEFQNIGRGNVFFSELEGFFKRGSFWGGVFKCLITDSSGKTKSPLPPLGIGQKLTSTFTIPNARFMSEKQIDEEIARMNADKSATETIVDLKPGEILATRADPPKSGFRDLVLNYSFDRPGRYKIRIEYPRPKIEESEDVLEEMVRQGWERQKILDLHQRAEREELGPATSNAVMLDVAP